MTSSVGIFKPKKELDWYPCAYCKSYFDCVKKMRTKTSGCPEYNDDCKDCEPEPDDCSDGCDL